MQIQIRINEEGALRNQRHAFSNRFTLVSELLQNARRAGATCIEILYDATTQVLCVRDDGRGLDDFQKLLSFHESGWDEATQAEERPFGIGFSKCLYAATRCIVASGRQRVDIDTAAALSKAPIEVEQMPQTDAVIGTRVELHGVSLPELGGRIEELCAGFAVPVHFNGRVLERRLAEANLATQGSAIGSVHLAGTRNGQYSRDTVVFLQGFCVLKPSWYRAGEVNVVHLDSRQFTARLPDRDRLIDEDIQCRRIDAELKALWRRTLEIAKTQFSPEQFVERYYLAMRGWGHLDLMNDIDVLPAALCETIVGYPIQAEHGDRNFLQPVAITPTRHDVETDAATLIAIDSVDEGNGVQWMLARPTGWMVFDWLGVHDDHWSRRHVRFLDEEAVAVQPESETLRTPLEGRWVWPTVILCEAVQVTVGNEQALIADAAVCHDGCIYVPAGETSGAAVRQLSSFTDENDQFLESDCDADTDALADLLFRLRSIDAVQTLDSLLQGLHLGRYPLLQGKAFRLAVGVGSAPGHSIALIEAERGGHAEP